MNASPRIKGISIRESFTLTDTMGRTRTWCSVEERLWASVDKSDNPDGCWVWTSYRNRKGYGEIGLRGRKTAMAHRVSYVLHYGEIPPNLIVGHHCDNPPCVNPAHLWAGVPRDNTTDMLRKRRHWSPGTPSRTKLSDEEVRAIRRWYAKGESCKSIARNMGLDASYVNRIVRRVRRGDTGPGKVTRVAIADRDGERCAVCGFPAEKRHLHHRKPRGMGGSEDRNTNLPCNLLLVCSTCHTYIEQH